MTDPGYRVALATALIAGLLAFAACGDDDEQVATAPAAATATTEVPEDKASLELDLQQNGDLDLPNLEGEVTIDYKVIESAYLRNEEQRFLEERNPENRYVGCATILATITGGGASDEVARAVERKLNELYPC